MSENCGSCGSKPCLEYMAIQKFIDGECFKGNAVDFESDAYTLFAKHCRMYSCDYPESVRNKCQPKQQPTDQQFHPEAGRH